MFSAPEAPPSGATPFGKRRFPLCYDSRVSAFDDALRELRRKAGFPSARSFFRARGGTRALGCTYKAYLDIEAGRSVPKPNLALTLAAALGAHADPRRGAAFAAGYLKARLGPGELTTLTLSALAARPRTDPGAFFERASRRSFAVRPRLPLSPRQAEALDSDPALYWGFTLLLMSREPLAPSVLARRLGLPAARMAAALTALERLALVERRRGGAYACPHVGKLVTWPRKDLYLAGHRAALRGHWEVMARRRGKVVFERRAGLRAVEAALKAGFPALLSAVYGTNIFARRAGGPDTAVFLVEARAARA